MILIIRSANISNYVLMDECVIVGGDWERCAGRSRNQKDPKCRMFPFTYVNPSRQATSPSTAQSTGEILNDVSVKDAAVRCLCCWWGKRCSPSGSGEISELRVSFVSALLSLIRGKKQSKNSEENCDASTVLTLPGCRPLLPKSTSHWGFQTVWQGCEWLHTTPNALKPSDRVENMDGVSWEMKDREASFEMPTLR